LQLLQTVNEQLPAFPALRGERVRALVALNRHAEALKEIRAMLKSGHEIQWIYYIQGLCYEQLNRHIKALKSYAIAEKRQWLEPEINAAKVRCLQALHRQTEANAERAKAARKRRYLGQ